MTWAFRCAFAAFSRSKADVHYDSVHVGRAPGSRSDFGCFQQGHEPRIMYPLYDNASLVMKMNRGGMLKGNMTPQQLLEVFTQMTQRMHAAAQRGLQGEMFETDG